MAEVDLRKASPQITIKGVPHETSLTVLLHPMDMIVYQEVKFGSKDLSFSLMVPGYRGYIDVGMFHEHYQAQQFLVLVDSDQFEFTMPLKKRTPLKVVPSNG